MCQTKYFMDKMNNVSRCRPVYSKRLAPLRPDSGVNTLRVIGPHIFINPSYSYVVFKNKLIFFLCSVNDAVCNVLFLKN